MPLARDIIERTLSTKQGSAAFDAVEVLSNAGYEAWWVGGCVRDMLQDRIPDDIDIATSALPKDIERLFPKSDMQAAALGSVIAAHKGVELELTTFREDDAASDGRHPESVKFGNRAQDSVRRDFTVNAIYFQPQTLALFDPHDGEKDLHNGLIRFIGDAETRIRHDALRMLRAVRFRAAIGGQYHPQTFQALCACAPLAKELSGVRQLAEFERMLLGHKPEAALEDLWETGILKYVFPELAACKGVAQPPEYHQEGDVWEHTKRCAASFTEDHSIDVRLAAVFHDCGKAKTFSVQERIRFDHHAEVSADIADEVFKRVQLPSARREKICWLIRHHMMMGSFAGLNNQRKSHWYHHPWFQELLQLFWLDIAGTAPSGFGLYESIVADYNAFLDSHPRPQKPLLSGTEVMEILGLQPGERVGDILKQLHQAQLEKQVTKKAEARAFLEQFRPKHP